MLLCLFVLCLLLLNQSEVQVEELQTELRAEQSRRASAETELASALEVHYTLIATFIAFCLIYIVHKLVYN
jgi:hypothetical protein